MFELIRIGGRLALFLVAFALAAFAFFMGSALPFSGDDSRGCTIVSPGIAISHVSSLAGVSDSQNLCMLQVHTRVITLPSVY